MSARLPSARFRLVLCYNPFMQNRERIVPFWFLNDRLEASRLTSQLEDIQGKGVREVIIHPRYGLPNGYYLSPEWFGDVNHIVGEAARLGMGIWIHDDINWPGGTADGRLTRETNTFRAQVMDLQGGSIHQRDGSYKIAYQNRCLK